MRMKFAASQTLALVLILAGLRTLNASAQDHSTIASSGDAIRVMSFNVRNGLAKDGPNHWDKRKDLLVRMIRESAADIIGTQETYPFQADFLRQQLKKYRYVGRSRDDADGEQCGILYADARFNKLDEGHFWLSETPDNPGSKSWDSDLPRMATWVKLSDKQHPREFVLINTHFDHRGREARRESAQIIHAYATRFAAHTPVIVTGDFNASVESVPYQTLTAKNQGVQLRDTFHAKHPIRAGAAKHTGTFNGFRGKTEGPRIDWILTSPAFSIRDAMILRFEQDGRYPSDHFPVTATLEYRPQ